MNVKKNIGFVIVLALLGFACLGAAVFAYVSFSSDATVKEDLQMSRSQYQQLMGKTPFPSSPNVDVMKDNLRELDELSQQWINSLMVGQIEPLYLQRAEFPPLVERKMNELWESAAKNKVELPESFAFGFKEYIAGKVPITNDIPRLTVQLETIYNLASTLFDSKISSLVNVEREVFENAKRPDETATRTSRRSSRRSRDEVEVKPAGVLSDETDLFVTEHYKITFEARDNAVWDVLNAFSRSTLFIVVHSMEIASPMSPHQPISFDKLREEKMRKMGNVKLKGNNVALQIDLPERDDRVVSGRERVNVSLHVIVYRFKPIDDRIKTSGKDL